MKKAILWAQNETPTTPETYVINGKKSACQQNSSKQRDAFDRLIEASKHSMLSPKDLENARSTYPDITTNYNYNIGKDFVYIQSNFLEKDQVGRRMPFMFFTNETTDISIAFSRLQEYAGLIHRTVSLDDLNFLQSIVEKRQKASLKQVIAEKHRKKEKVLRALISHSQEIRAIMKHIQKKYEKNYSMGSE